jgi:phosphatidylserine decarboxylase
LAFIKEGELEFIISEENNSRVLNFLYKTAPGRLCLKIVVNPVMSKIGGIILSSRISTVLINPFIKRNGINMSEYENKKYCSFNDFFTRKIQEGKREIDFDSNHLISPCDAKLTVYEIGEKSVFNIKGSFYRIRDLLQNDVLADNYRGGFCLIFRLSPQDYHRYCFIDDGSKGNSGYIRGVLHTVRNVSLERYNIYKENCREYTVLNTNNFGQVIQVEVGALMIGRIKNHNTIFTFKRGQEKGWFEFGGSTIVLLLKKKSIHINPEILIASKKGRETIVKLGEKIGEVNLQSKEPEGMKMIPLRF